ncbi:MAG: hypothetical protein IKC88_05810 [Opitutales bacterium]|nr:hypothetical protein [Opitutales bacterium]
MKKFIIFFLATLSICVAQTSVEKTQQNLKKVAIFVRNDSDEKLLSKKIDTLESNLSARLNNMGFGVISHNLVIKSLDNYLNSDDTKIRNFVKNLKEEILDKKSADKNLFESASGLRIAEIIGADYIVATSIASFGAEKKSFKGYGVKTDSIVYILQCNYNLFESSMGVGSTGGTSVASKTIRQSQNLKIESTDIINELLDQVAGDIALQLEQKNKSGKIVAKQNLKTDVIFDCVLSDFSFPEIILENGKYKVGSNSIPVGIKYITLEIDGIAQNANEKLKLTRGIHVVRINQKDIEPIEKTINVIENPDGQKFYFSLSLSDSARIRLKDDMAFIQAIKERAKASDDRRILTEAEAERLRGCAKMLEQSGYKIDIDHIPETKVQSIFGQ